MSIKCCYQCKARTEGCHSTCADYIKERKELDELNKRIHEEKRSTTEFYEHFEPVKKRYKKRTRS